MTYDPGGVPAGGGGGGGATEPLEPPPQLTSGNTRQKRNSAKESALSQRRRGDGLRRRQMRSSIDSKVPAKRIGRGGRERPPGAVGGRREPNEVVTVTDAVPVAAGKEEGVTTQVVCAAGSEQLRLTAELKPSREDALSTFV